VINPFEIPMLSFEIRREFAPYIGVSYNRKLSETADLAEADGEDIDVTSFVVGVRMWFLFHLGGQFLYNKPNGYNRIHWYENDDIQAQRKNCLCKM
jgi:hypothetical protein